jgi:hypothetical protein
MAFAKNTIFSCVSMLFVSYMRSERRCQDLKLDVCMVL